MSSARLSVPGGRDTMVSHGQRAHAFQANTQNGDVCSVQFGNFDEVEFPVWADHWRVEQRVYERQVDGETKQHVVTVLIASGGSGQLYLRGGKAMTPHLNADVRPVGTEIGAGTYAGTLVRTDVIAGTKPAPTP